MPTLKQEQLNQGRGQVQQAVHFLMVTEQCYCTLTDFHILSLVTRCLKHMLPSYLWSITGQWHFIMDGQLNMLKIKSANKWRPEGAQVKISIVLMCLANISYCHSIGIMKASSVGSRLTKFNNKAIFWHKLCHSFLAQQLKERKEKKKINNKRFCSPQLGLRHLYSQRPFHTPWKKQLRT